MGDVLNISDDEMEDEIDDEMDDIDND